MPPASAGPPPTPTVLPGPLASGLPTPLRWLAAQVRQHGVWPAAITLGVGTALLALTLTALCALLDPVDSAVQALWVALLLPVPVALLAGAAVLLLLTALDEAQARIERLQCTDALTGLATRQHLMQQAQALIGQTLNQAAPLSLVLLDLDRFKLTNDQRGLAAADRVLQQTAARLQAVLQPGERLGRWAGEEFAVLMPETDGPQAARRVDALRAALRPPVLVQPGEPAQWLTASFGLATVVPPATADLDTLVRLADDALYIARHEGRDTVRVVQLGPGQAKA